LKQVNQEESYGFLYLLRNVANVSFLKMEFDNCEKVLLEANSLSNALNGDNMQNRFINQIQLSTLYMYRDIDMACEFNEAEILAIYDAKKDYNQDEKYFAYLDAGP
jgi:hypothetical protein